MCRDCIDKGTTSSCLTVCQCSSKCVNLEQGPRRELDAVFAMTQSLAAHTADLEGKLEAGRASTEVDAARSTPQSRQGAGWQHAAQAKAEERAYCTAAAKQSQHLRLDPYVPDSECCTGVLPAAEPKGPLEKCCPFTLTRPCVRCCCALWA